MAGFAVVTDNAASLPESALNNPNLFIIDIAVFAGQEQIFNHQQIANAFSEGQALSTAAPSVAQFSTLYRQLVQLGYEHIFSLHLSAKLSSTFEHAQIAAQQFADKVSTVDTKTAGLAEGLYLAEILELISNGGSKSEILNRCANYHPYELFLLPRSMESLKQGGRIKAGAAMVAQLFQITPWGKMVDGKLLYAGRAKSFEAAAQALIKQEIVVQPYRKVYLQADGGQLPPEFEKVSTYLSTPCFDIPLPLSVHAGLGAVALVLEP